MDNRKSLILHFDSLDVIDELSNEQIAQLFKAIRDYNLGKEVYLDGLMKAVFIPFKNQFDRDLEKYKKKCEVNAENIKKRWDKDNIPTDTTGINGIPTNTDYTYNNSNSNSDNKRDTVNENKNIYRKFKHLEITQEEFNKLNEIYTKESIDNVLNNIENFKDNKKYTSLYLTANNWLKRDGVIKTRKIDFNSLL